MRSLGAAPRRIRESFWLSPTTHGVAAIVLTQLLVSEDEGLHRAGTSIPFLDGLSTSGGRSILTTSGTTLLTVAGTSFSITISVLATTPATCGSHVVRNFMADDANRLVLDAT